MSENKIVIENEEEIKQKITEHYGRIEKFFKNKQLTIMNAKQLPLEEVLENAPKYYPFIRFVQQLNSFINNDPRWLENFVAKNKIQFDWESYNRWKSGKDSYKQKYNETTCPSKWIHLILEKLIDALKALQILLYVEFYISDEDFRRFLKQFPEIDFKMIANYKKKSTPSEDLKQIFEVINYLLKVNFDNNLTVNYVVDTVLVVKVYNHIDDSGILDLLKRKENFIKFRLDYLRLMPKSIRPELPLESELIGVCEEYLQIVSDLIFSYKEFKSRLITKYEKARSKFR